MNRLFRRWMGGIGLFLSRFFRIGISLWLVLVLLAADFTFSYDTSYADTASDRFTVSKETYPTTLTQGSSFSISGMITGTNNITRVEVGIVSKSTGKYVSGFYFNKTGLKTKSYSIANADSSIKFGKLPKGDYYYRVWAHDSAGAVKVLDKAFSVKASGTSSRA